MKAITCVTLCALSACIIPLGSVSKAKAPIDGLPSTQQSALCDSIDRERSFWTVAATSLATISGGSGITSLPIDDPETKRALAITSCVAGGLSAIAAIVAADRAQRWVKVCQ